MGETNMRVPAAVMVNILGKRQGKSFVTGLDDALGISNVGVHLYGKQETRLDRKMGYLIAVSDSLHQALENALVARSLISI